MGINWIDPAGVVRWVFPRKGNEGIVDKQIYEPGSPRFHEKFQILHSNQNIITPCAELIQGGLGFNTFLPLVYSGRIQ